MVFDDWQRRSPNTRCRSKQEFLCTLDQRYRFPMKSSFCITTCSNNAVCLTHAGTLPWRFSVFCEKNKETISNSRRRIQFLLFFSFSACSKADGQAFSFLFFYRRLHNETGSNPLPIWKFFRLSATCEILWWPLTSFNWFVLCDLRIVSGTVYHLEQPNAQSLFLFPIVFGNNLITFFDGTKDNEAVHSIVYTTSLW